jgi:hypothetical protein
MTAMRISTAGPAMGLGLLLLISSTAAAEEFVCRGTLGAVTKDNVRVPQAATCIMDGTRVKGTITVQRGAILRASRIVVIGNVQAEGARRVNINRRSRVGGSVQVVQGFAAAISNSVIDGSIQLTSNSAALSVVNNTVGADIQAFQNTGGIEISDNSVDGNLQCKANVPAPTGGGNIVQGNKEDQCRRL